ncbi:E3 ubiquitin-protein ligase Topors isoform X1 [Hydra vulgaris]|uniref:E3 ubiquitin-protein ligase Topors isoform X1 n=1 Tax=Hydra vulgaris TaxID=6087 RepID=UPI001F5EE368|nr:E3 ubiquitin-protein ligase Topors isoform X1 [Hydra vulgaris]
MTSNFLNSDEEAVLRLRIDALKSASRKAFHRIEQSISSEMENESENELREMALKSISKDSSKIRAKKTEASNIERKEPIKHSNDDLKLRQVALKSLLQKRLLKTEDLLKKANNKVMQQNVQNKDESITPIKPSTKITDLKSKKIEDHKSVTKITKPKSSSKIIKTIKTRDKTVDKSLTQSIQNTAECIVKQSKIESDQNGDDSMRDTFVRELSISKILVSQNEDDQISLCVSDNDDKELCLSDNDDKVSCVSDHEGELLKNNTDLCKVKMTITDSKSNFDDLQSLEKSNDLFQLPIDCTPLLSVVEHSFGSIDNNDIDFHNNNTTSKNNFSEDSKLCSEQSEILENQESRCITDLNSVKGCDDISAEDKDLNMCENHAIDSNKTSSLVSNFCLDNNEPGPSGYKKSNDVVYDSDAEHSIIEITPPAKKTHLVIELSSDSDSSFVDKTSSLGNKALIKNKRRSKQKVIQEELSRQTTKSPGREDMKDSICSVCLGPFENRSFLLECFHSFCHICIIQWSELSRTCPLCKTKYKSLIHSVNSDLEYQQYTFPEESKLSDQVQTQRVQNGNDGRRFRYQTTLVDSHAWARRRAERERVENTLSQGREQRKMSRRLKWSATKDRRKAVYRLHMHVKEVKQRGRPKLRDISCEFFKENPALKHRLVPWLLRDLNVLLGDNDENIRFVMSLILNLISNISMECEEFKKQLEPFLFKETDHFIAELISFARSPYDIKGYDDNVVYDVSIHNPVHVIEDSLQERLLNDILDGNDDDDSRNIVTSIDVGSNSTDSPIVQNIDTSPEVEVSPEVECSQEEVEEKLEEHDTDISRNKKKKKKKKRRKHKKRSKENITESVSCVDNDDIDTERVIDGGNEEAVNDFGDKDISSGHQVTNNVRDNLSNDIREIIDDGDNLSNDIREIVIDDGEIKEHLDDQNQKHKKYKKKHSKHRHKKRHRKHFDDELLETRKHKRKRLDNEDAESLTHIHKKKKKEDNHHSSHDSKHKKKKKSNHHSRKRKHDNRDDCDIGNEKCLDLGNSNIISCPDKTLINEDILIGDESTKTHSKKKKTEHKLERTHKTERKSDRTHKKKAKKHKSKKKRKRNHSNNLNSNSHHDLTHVIDLRETEKKIESLFASISKRYNLPLMIPSEEKIYDKTLLENESSKNTDFETMDKNAREVRDFIHNLNPQNNAYESRVDIVRELLRVEKALIKKKDRKERCPKTKIKQVAADSTVYDLPETLTYEPKKQFQNDKTYIALMSELQEIEGRLSSCRSSFLKNNEKIV